MFKHIHNYFLWLWGRKESAPTERVEPIANTTSTRPVEEEPYATRRKRWEKRNAG